jgi:hypothetical protein
MIQTAAQMRVLVAIEPDDGRKQAPSIVYGVARSWARNHPMLTSLDGA